MFISSFLMYVLNCVNSAKIGFVAIVLIVCRTGVGIDGSIIPPNNDSASETDGQLHLDQYILLLLPFHKIRSILKWQ